MRNILVSTIACLALLACGAGPGVAADLDRVGFALDGHDRQYLIYRPDSAAPGPRPMVLVLHGGGGTARGMVRLTRERWHSLADRHGFVVVYPDAHDRIWDFGDGIVSRGRKVRVDDLRYLRTVIDRVVTTHPIDPQRVFATGISRGGQASYFLACRLAGRIRAIAPVVMPLPAFLADDCRKGPPVGLLVMNGTHDPLVPYDGGQIRVFRRDRGAVLSTDATAALWRRRNGCDETAVRTRTVDRPGDATWVEIREWQGCGVAPVLVYRVQNGGHTWPSGRPYLGRRIIGEVSRDIDAAEEIWRFFARF